MKNTLRGMLALGFVVVGCGDDGGGEGDGELTLAQALETSGSNVSQARVDLVFPAACEAQRMCDEQTQAECLAENQDVYEAMVKTRSAACRDATLDLYSCFAVTPCEEYDDDETCNEIGTRQKKECG